MTNKIAKGGFYLLATALLAWTAWRSYHLLSLTIPGNPILPVLGVTVFDAGMVIWLLYFLNAAEGTVQRAVAVSASAIDLLLVVAASGFDYFLAGQSIAAIPAGAGEWALWTIVVATAVNLVAVWLAHAFEPSARENMNQQDMVDSLTEGGYKYVKANKQKLVAEYAPVMGQRLMQEAITRATGIASGNGHKSATTYAAEVPATKSPVPNG